jgi:hypothetical protein
MATDLEALAARLQRVEDELAIQRVVLSYGTAADAGTTERAGARWADDGEYDWDPDIPLLIDIDGDRATALSYSFVLRRDADQRVSVWRLGAARWELVRVDGRWKIHRRTHRQLDETGAGRELFGETLRGEFRPAFGEDRR